MSAPRYDASGPVICWLDYGYYEGWKPLSFDTPEDLLGWLQGGDVFPNRFVATRKLKLELGDTA